jgi:hypothetical protein
MTTHYEISPTLNANNWAIYKLTESSRYLVDKATSVEDALKYFAYEKATVIVSHSYLEHEYYHFN